VNGKVVSYQFGFKFCSARTGTIHEITPNRANKTSSASWAFVDRSYWRAAISEFDMALKLDGTLNPGLQNRSDQIVKGRNSKP
jgi:hypothetical protein